MIFNRPIAKRALLSSVPALLYSAVAVSQTTPVSAAPAKSSVESQRDGQHNFDFEIGNTSS